jgi:hypothetical protein
MTTRGREYVRDGATDNSILSIEGDLPLPSLDRRETVRLDEEGLSINPIQPLTRSSDRHAQVNEAP